MGGGKETPRQKMIGLMYLVLMALLAMNVSKEVINAFVTLNDKIEAGNTIIKGTMDGAYGSFEQAIAGLVATGGSKEDIDKIKEIQDQALRVKEWSKSLTNYFVDQSSELIKFSLDGAFGTKKEGDSKGDKHYDIDEQGYYHLFPLLHLEKKDDYDAATNLYVGESHANPKGQYVVDSILDYRNRLCTLIANYTDDKGVKWEFIPPDVKYEKEGDPESKKKFYEGIEAALTTVNPADTALVKQIFSILTPPEKTDNHGQDYPWIAKQFDHAPLVAAVAMFTAIRSDILQAENKAVTHIASRVSSPKFNFNKIEPLAFAPASYINQGDSIKLKVMIAAYDSTENMKLEYWIDDESKSGTGISYEAPAGSRLKLPGGGVGAHTIYGNIAVKEKGVEKWKPWKFDYSVGAPNAAVSAYDMNVLYVGWANRIKVAAGGFPPDQVSVTGSGCTLTKQGDFWIAKVSSITAKPEITVSAKDENGKSTQLEKQVFRVMPLPLPYVLVGGNGPDKTTMPVAQGKSLAGIALKLDAPLDIKYTVASFDLMVTVGGAPKRMSSGSAAMSGEMKQALSAQNKGSIISFTNVKVNGPNGKVSIPGASFQLN
jgi:gliding motility-associated protein GldM